MATYTADCVFHNFAISCFLTTASVLVKSIGDYRD